MSKLNINNTKQQINNLSTKIELIETNKREVFDTKYQRRIKSDDVYSMLSMLFFFGLHHLYIGKYLLCMRAFGLSLLSISFLILGYPLVSVFIIVLIVFLEARYIFGSTKIIKDYNEKLAKKILNEIDNKA